MKKATAWKLFSDYIRWRDTNWEGYCECITCHRGMRHPDTCCDAGHFISKKHECVRFDERNVHVQCTDCNRHYDGEPVKYAKEIARRYGEETLEDLDRLKRCLKKWKPWELDIIGNAVRAKQRGETDILITLDNLGIEYERRHNE